MANPMIHSVSSAKRFGGIKEDYFSIHDLIDAPKVCYSNNTSRAITHQNWFCEKIIPKIFGNTIINSDGIEVSTIDIALFHVSEDFRSKFIPTAEDYLKNISNGKFTDHKYFGGNLLSKYQKRWTGNREDYVSISTLLDSPTKEVESEYAYILTHNSWFCYYIIPRIFWYEIINSSGKRLDTVDVAMFHIIEDFAKLPTPQDYLTDMKLQQWMCNGVKDVENPTATKIYEDLRTKYSN